MDWDDLLPLFALASLVGLVLAIKGQFDARAARAQLRTLTDRFWMLDHRLVRLDERVQGIAVPAGAPPEAATEVAPPPAAEAAPPAAEEPAFAATATVGGAAPRMPRGDGRRFEQILVENWLVWLGGVTLVLGGAFLVKLSIDYGLLTPVVRVALGVLLGFGLSGAAEWTARRDRPQEGDAGPAYVPQTLAAAGAATVFASLYAAHQLYGLLPAFIAFPLMALTAAATAAISLRHGPIVAALGLVGAYAVPLLVQTDAPSATALFAYLAAAGAAALALLRLRPWRWLAWVTVGGAIGWTWLWLAAEGAKDLAVVAAFLLAQLALFALFRRGVPRVALLAGVADGRVERAVTRTAFWLIAASIFALVHTGDFGTTGLVCALAAVLFLLWFAFRDAPLDDVIAAAGMLPLTLLASWTLPLTAPPADAVMRALPPEQVARFAAAALVSAVALGGCFFVLPRVARPGRWAVLSAAAGPLILAIAYWRLRKFELDIAWSAAALALAGIELAGAAWVARRRPAERQMQLEIALAAYAVGVLAATILAATFALSNAWLTVALALHLPALGWIEGRIRLPALRWLALGMAAIVLVRLVLNPSLLSYPLASDALVFNWLLYGYGVPAAAFIVATRQFGSRADDALVAVLEAGSIAFTFLLLTLELRHGLYGRLDAPLTSLMRDALQTLLWLAMSGVLLRLAARRGRPVLRVGGVVLFAGATLQAVLWQALIANPLWSEEPVGRWLVADALTLAFGLPALLYAAIARLRSGVPGLAPVARVLAAGFAFIWLTLEIRHAFRGEVLSGGRAGEFEWYAYSTGWLVFAATGLAVSLVRPNQWLRRASLAGIGLVVAKVFLFDMAALAGILRALSFLGLGGALIGIGYAYRRMRPLQPPATLPPEQQPEQP